MPDSESIFTDALAYDPSADFHAAALAAPARWAVCLLETADGRPVQLLSVKNLRYCLRRRLGEPGQDEGPTRRIDYRQIVRRARWRRVDSDFEADLIYLEAARRLFPESYRSMTGYRPAWFVHVNPDTPFPRFIKTADLNLSTGVYLGPLDSKGDAAKLIEQTQDLFDLCRFYSILVQAPDGPACAYKEMGKCPAPCDGSISMESYRQAVRWAADSVLDPTPLLADATGRMKAAAAALNFEAAGRIKKYVEEIEALNDRKFRHVRRVEEFRWLAPATRPARGNGEGVRGHAAVDPGGGRTDRPRRRRRPICCVTCWPTRASRRGRAWTPSACRPSATTCSSRRPAAFSCVWTGWRSGRWRRRTAT